MQTYTRTQTYAPSNHVNHVLCIIQAEREKERDRELIERYFFLLLRSVFRWAIFNVDLCVCVCDALYVVGYIVID